MRWRTYNDIIEKLCAWFMYQHLYQKLDANGMLSDPKTKRVMEYMHKLCISSAPCSTRTTCKDIWNKKPFRHGISSCLEYLAKVIHPTVFQALESIVSTHMARPCRYNPILSEFRVIDAENDNNSWRIIRKESRHSGNQLMFFLNDDDHIHVSIPSLWNINKELHILFNENDTCYKHYRPIRLYKNKVWYSYGETVVVHDHNEHHIRFTHDQHVKCEMIFHYFKFMHDELRLWMCDKTNTELLKF